VDKTMKKTLLLIFGLILIITSMNVFALTDNTEWTLSQSASVSGLYGFKFKPLQNLTIINITKLNADASVTCFLQDANHIKLANGTFTSNVCPINYNVTNDILYYMMYNGSSYPFTIYYDNSATFPKVLTNFNITKNWDSFSDTTTNPTSILNISYTLPPPITTYTIKGNISYNNTAFTSSANVSLISGDLSTIQNTVSNSTGKYLFSNLLQNTYYFIMASYPNGTNTYTTSSFINVTGDVTKNLDFYSNATQTCTATTIKTCSFSAGSIALGSIQSCSS
jgi:hypothetical protein